VSTQDQGVGAGAGAGEGGAAQGWWDVVKAYLQHKHSHLGGARQKRALQLLGEAAVGRVLLIIIISSSSSIISSIIIIIIIIIIIPAAQALAPWGRAAEARPPATRRGRGACTSIFYAAPGHFGVHHQRVSTITPFYQGRDVWW
jgi:hypothetical protein